MPDFAAQIGGHALQTADGHGLAIQAPAAAGRLARAVAGAAEDCREHVRLPVEHVGVGVPALRDQPDVFRNVGMRGACPLAIDDFVEIVRVLNVCRFHSFAYDQRLGDKRLLVSLLYTREDR